MKKIPIFVSFLLLTTISPVLANGGGYFRGGVENTGDIAGFEPQATENIRLLDEKLDIKVGKESAKVEVRYLMKNVTDKRVKVRFGFPVEEARNPELMGLPEDKAPDPENLQYCRDYQITASDKPVKSTWQGELKPNKDNLFTGISGWLISELTFTPGEEIPVMIAFESDYPVESWSVNEDTTDSAAIFRYRLSTAACWNGTIGSGRIAIELDGINPADIRVIKPVNRFKKEGDRWVWNFANLEPTLADDLEIECQPAIRTYGRFHHTGEEYNYDLYTKYIERGERWSIIHSNYKIKASSTLKPNGELRYDPENLRSRWSEDAWSEGEPGPGIDSWLEITPVEPKPLWEILLTPGYQKGALFKANARPKTIRIELNDEHKFEAKIPDLAETVEIPIVGYEKPVHKIRLTIAEVYPGTRFEDLCLTALELHAKLDRKPEIQPVR